MTLPVPLTPMPTLARCASLLWSNDDGHRYRYSLVAPEDCRRIIAEYEVWNVPVGNKIAARIAKVLIGSYPVRKVNDPAVYSRAIVSVLAEFPADVGKAAADKVTRELKFLPTRADVLAALKEIKGEIDHLVRTARYHLEEHARRERKEAEDRETAARLKWKDKQWPDLRHIVANTARKMRRV